MVDFLAVACLTAAVGCCKDPASRRVHPSPLHARLVHRSPIDQRSGQAVPCTCCMKSLLRLVRSHPRSGIMNGTATAAVAPGEGAAATAAVAPSETATIAAVSKHLRELAAMLDSQGVQSAAEVGASLQQLSQQLLQHPARPAEQPSVPAAADVAALERLFAAPPAAGAATQPAAVVQPLSKKQRREGGFSRHAPAHLTQACMHADAIRQWSQLMRCGSYPAAVLVDLASTHTAQ